MTVFLRRLVLVSVAAWICGGHVMSQDACPTCVKSKIKTVYRTHCHRCKRMRPQCGCQQPMLMPMPVQTYSPPMIQAVPQTTYEPVYETQYRPQQIVTNRPVLETQYRTESYVENVPVTRYDNITVDEGHYAQIWVPKMVTKQVPKTVMEQRTNCRTVPVQVQKCVSEVSTKMVPYQSVRYVAKQTCVPSCIPGTTTTLSGYPALSSYPLASPTTAYAPAPTNYAALPSYNNYDAQPVPSYLGSPASLSGGIDESQYSIPQAIPARNSAASTPSYGARFSTPSAISVQQTPRGTVIR